MKTLIRVTSLMVQEVMGTLSFAGYGWKALCLHRDIPLTVPMARPGRTTHDAVYGPKPRNLIDVYHPVEAKGNPCQSSVVLFVHGGVWSSGEKWQYAPLGKGLAQKGVTTCVMSYTLFPEASATEIAKEVNMALDWVMQHVASTDTVPPHVTLIGHSSGAHSVMMAILERAKQGSRMPDAVVAMCGVYDIAQHYAYESHRGVQDLSSMKRAVGGLHRFFEGSPICLFKELLTNAKDSVHGLTRRHLKQLPSIALMTSKLDKTVPSCQSLELHQLLKKLGCRSEFVMYDDVLHSHFATKCWTSEIFDGRRASHIFVDDLVSMVKREGTQEAWRPISEAGG